MSRVDPFSVTANRRRLVRAYSKGMDPQSNPIGYLVGHPFALGLVISVALLVLTLKGFALWRAARAKSLGWFIVLLVVNTLGILELLYLFVFGKKKS
ncbi:MAG: hypothetical protein RLZ72_1003 [Actinomycetota bacterium]